MRPRCPSSVALVLTCLSPLVAGAAETPFAELAHHVPDSANAIVLVNVRKLFSRPWPRQKAGAKMPRSGSPAA